MTLSITTALASLVVLLLGTLIALTWRSATLATKLLLAVSSLEKKDDELTAKLVALDKIPGIEQRLTFAERHNSEMPKLVSRVLVLEQAAKFSKEMRGVLLRRSRPDTEPDDDE